jgi:hypothetical protein
MRKSTPDAGFGMVMVSRQLEGRTVKGFADFVPGLAARRATATVESPTADILLLAGRHRTQRRSLRGA